MGSEREFIAKKLCFIVGKYPEVLMCRLVWPKYVFRKNNFIGSSCYILHVISFDAIVATHFHWYTFKSYWHMTTLSLFDCLHLSWLPCYINHPESFRMTEPGKTWKRVGSIKSNLWKSLIVEPVSPAASGEGHPNARKCGQDVWKWEIRLWSQVMCVLARQTSDANHAPTSPGQTRKMWGKLFCRVVLKGSVKTWHQCHATR